MLQELYRQYLELEKEIGPEKAIEQFVYLHPIALSRLKKRIRQGIEASSKPCLAK